MSLCPGICRRHSVLVHAARGVQCARARGESLLIGSCAARYHDLAVPSMSASALVALLHAVDPSAVMLLLSCLQIAQLAPLTQPVLRFLSRFAATPGRSGRVLPDVVLLQRVPAHHEVQLP